MHRLPSSPSRARALSDFETRLLQAFSARTTTSPPETRDAMHYLLFSAEDRFCVSSAWLIAPRVGVQHELCAEAAIALECLRCAIGFKATLADRRDRSATDKFVDPATGDAAASGLVSLAFEIILSSGGALVAGQRIAIGAALAEAYRPQSDASEGRVGRMPDVFSRHDFQRMGERVAAPVFRAAGRILEILSGRDGQLASWFNSLGIYAHWVAEFADSPRSASPEAMDLLKSLEAELLERSRPLSIDAEARQIIDPLAETLKIRLQ